jgi:hypothetical protein
LGYAVSRIVTDGWRVKALEAVELATGQVRTFAGEHFFSTAPMRDLMRWFDAPPPAEVLRVSDGLVYRDLIIVGLLVRALKIGDESPQGRRLIADNWIYIHEPDVQLSRVQIFNNWSPHLVADPTLVWLGLEYSCNRGDALWNLTDVRMTELATSAMNPLASKRDSPTCWNPTRVAVPSSAFTVPKPSPPGSKLTLNHPAPASATASA